MITRGFRRACDAEVCSEFDETENNPELASKAAFRRVRCVVLLMCPLPCLDRMRPSSCYLRGHISSHPSQSFSSSILVANRCVMPINPAQNVIGISVVNDFLGSGESHIPHVSEAFQFVETTISFDFTSDHFTTGYQKKWWDMFDDFHEDEDGANNLGPHFAHRPGLKLSNGDDQLCGMRKVPFAGRQDQIEFGDAQEMLGTTYLVMGAPLIREMSVLSGDFDKDGVSRLFISWCMCIVYSRLCCADP